MTPDKLAKSDTEHAHQVAVFAYCAIVTEWGWDIADEWCQTGDFKAAKANHEPKPVPQLKWYHAIPNGGARGDSKKSSMIRGAEMKAEGVKKGVSDTFLPWSNGLCHGLYIEMKKPDQRPKTDRSKGGMSDEQIKFRDYVQENGYGFMVCYDWKEAVTTLRQYIEW